MSPRLQGKVCLGSTTCPGFYPGGFAATISVSLVVQFLGICLAVIIFENSISSLILRDGVCM
jgi:hypothetical protein